MNFGYLVIHPVLYTKFCILRVEYQNLDDGEWYTDYLTSTWGKFGWAEDYLERIADIANEYRITHWKPINKPKGVEE